MRLTAKLLGILFAFVLVLTFSKATFAQVSPTQNQQAPQYLTPNTNPDVPQNLHTWTQSLMIEVVSSMVCQLVGVDPTSQSKECLGIDPSTGKLGFVQNGGGVIGLFGNMISSTFTVPVRVGDYIAYTESNFGIAKQANAQVTGIGYNGLIPIQKLWQIFRDIAYLFFVVIFLVVGIAIMLRVKIDPRTVMTIQNQIPKLIIGIVLVTFSYAISGLLIDTMWISNYLVVNTMANATSLSNESINAQMTQGAPGFVNYILAPSSGLAVGGLLNVTTGASFGIGDVIQNMFSSTDNPNSINTNLAPGTTKNNCDWLCTITDPGRLIGDIIGGVLGFIISWIARIVGWLIIAIAVLWAVIKLWISLIKAYVFVLIDTVLAPFWILAGLIPGVNSSVNVGSWFRDLFANLAVFPAVIGLFMFARVVMDNFGSSTVATSFNPPLIGGVSGNINPGITASSGTNGIGPLIALGIILMSPTVAESIKKAVKSSGVSTGFKGLSTGTAVMGAIAGGAWSRMYYRDPRTGQTNGPVARAITRAQGVVGDSRVAQAVRRFRGRTPRGGTGTGGAGGTGATGGTPRQRNWSPEQG